jgi:hypothetical protein
LDYRDARCSCRRCCYLEHRSGRSLCSIAALTDTYRFELRDDWRTTHTHRFSAQFAEHLCGDSGEQILGVPTPR